MKKLLIALMAVILVCAGCVNDPDGTPEKSQTAQRETSGTAEPSQQLTPGASKPSQQETPGASEPAKEQTPKAPATGGAAKKELPEITKREIKYTNEGIDVDIACPVISGMLDAQLQQQINERIYGELENMASENERGAASDTMKAGRYYLLAGYSVKRNDGRFISIREHIDFYAGGASSGTNSIFINLLNTRPGKELALEDLFLPDSNYISSVNSEINALISEDPFGSEYSFNTVSAEQSYYMTDKKLVIVFARYEIASGASGEPEFAVPLENLSEILIPELK